MVTIVDVGAVGGLNKKWDAVKHRAVLFEPNPDAKFDPRENWQVIRKALSDSNGKRKLYIARKATNSSFYKPNFEFINQFPKAARFETVGEIELETGMLDTELVANGVADADVIKLDVQGHELPVLKGGRETLKKVVAVEVEVEFKRVYENQPLFGEVDTFLKENGFELSKFHNLTSWKSGKVEYLVWGEAVYFKKEELLSSEKREHLSQVKKILLAENKKETFNFKLAVKRILASFGLRHHSLGIKISQPAKTVKILELKTQALKTFIESGAHVGRMSAEVGDKFEQVYSIEFDENLYRQNVEKFLGTPRVKFLKDDNAVKLREILKKQSGPILFWLDAHSSGEITSENSPIIAELNAIFSHTVRSHVILIDDARHFDRKTIGRMKELARVSGYKFELEDGIFRLHGK